MTHRWGVLVLLVFATACGSDDKSPAGWKSKRFDPAASETIDITCPTKPVDPSRVRVMVVDNGFDARHPIFKGKIAGCFRLTCPEDSASFRYVPGETDDAAAARMIGYLSTPSPDCGRDSGVRLTVASEIEHFDS